MIETQRLIIKSWQEDQVQDFLELTQDDGLNLHLITHYRQPDAEAALKWIRSARQVNQETRLGKWAVWEKDSSTLIGLGGLTPWQFDGEKMVDITYRFREAAWGKGYGMELAKALCQYAFDEINLPEITATITPDNIGSKKILEKLGMNFDRRILLLNVETDMFRLEKENFPRA